MSGTPMKSGNARVFIIEGRARGDHAPSYQYSLRVTGPSQGFGDVTRIEEPDPSRYDTWRQAGEIRGAAERATATLEGHYARNVLSTLLTIARKRCAVDVQLHFGACQDPRVQNSFDKVLFLENAIPTSWGGGDMGALQQDDSAVVDETLDISADDMYEVAPMIFGSKAGTLISNEVVDVSINDYPSCGDCAGQSDGCYKIFAVTLAAGGSPATIPDIVYSIDKGVTWYLHDIEDLTTPASGVDVVGEYVIVISNGAGGYEYALTSEFDGVTDPSFTLITTGFVTGKKPNAIWSYGNGAFIVGESGYIYTMTATPADGVTVVEAATVTSNWLLDVHGLSEDFAVAVGNNGTVLYTANGTNWTAVTFPLGVGTNLNCVFVKSELEWWVGTSTGRMYYTVNGGTTWTEKTFSGSGAGRVDDIEFATDSVGYMAHATATPAGRIFRTIDGGYSWYVMPEGSSSIPANDRINALAVCSYDPNFVVGVGLADDASDGVVVLGTP